MRWVKSFINKEFQGFSIGSVFLLIFVSHIHAQNEPVDIAITFDESFDLGKIQYGYYDGRKTTWSEPLSKNVVHLKDTLYGKLGALYVRYNGDSVRDSKDFFIRVKKTSISFGNREKNDLGVLSNFKEVNATCFDSLAARQAFNTYQKDQAERISAFWEQYGSVLVPGRKDSINDKFAVLLKERNSKILSFIETYSGTDEYLYYLFKDQVLTSSLAFRRNDVDYLKSLDEFLKNRFPQSFLDANDGKYLKSMLNSYIQVRDGEAVPDFTAFDINGNKISSDGLKGKVVLFNFWASWCAPCIAEMPFLKKLKEKYKDDLHIVGVSSDTDSTSFNEARRKYDMNWIHIFNGQSIRNTFAVNSIPAQYLINKEGVIVHSSYQNKNKERLSSLIADSIEK